MILRGGSEIFPYWITVFAVSAPFIYFMTRYAEQFNLGKLEVLITTSLLGLHSLMFPSYMRKEQILFWVLLSGGILLCPWGIALIKCWRSTNKEGASLGFIDSSTEIAIAKEEEPNEEFVALLEEEEPNEEFVALLEEEEPNEEVVALVEVEEPIKEDTASVVVEDMIEEASCCSDVDVVTLEVKKFSLEEIIEKGFQAKEESDFDLAAEWFLIALDRKPSYDIAFYLIIESYQPGKNGYSTKEALNKVRPYVNEYCKDAPLEWSMKLTAWLQEQKL